MFDPYYEWLGIPSKDQPPNLYRLLGIELFEPNRNVIDTAANRQMSFLKEYQAGEHSELTQRLLNELAAARLCLLNKEKKAAYDEELRASLKAKEAPARPPPLGHVRKAEGPPEDTQATPEYDVAVPLRVPMTPPIAFEPILPPTINTQPRGLSAEARVSPRTPISAESGTAVNVEPVELGPSSRVMGMVLGIAVGLACAAFAVLGVLWAASLLSRPRSADRQTAEREDQDNPRTVEFVANLPRTSPSPPNASNPSAEASVGDKEPAGAVEANPSQPEQPATQDSSAPKPTDKPQPKESGTVPDPLPSETPKTVSEKAPAPPAVEPMPAANTEPVSQPPPVPAENVPAKIPPTPPVAETPEQAEQRLKAELTQASTAEERRRIGQEALMFADKAILDSQAELARRLAVLALRAARDSSSPRLVTDATVLMGELATGISDALKDKAKQRLDKQ